MGQASSPARRLTGRQEPLIQLGALWSRTGTTALPVVPSPCRHSLALVSGRDLPHSGQYFQVPALSGRFVPSTGQTLQFGWNPRPHFGHLGVLRFTTLVIWALQCGHEMDARSSAPA